MHDDCRYASLRCPPTPSRLSTGGLTLPILVHAPSKRRITCGICTRGPQVSLPVVVHLLLIVVPRFSAYLLWLAGCGFVQSRCLSIPFSRGRNLPKRFVLTDGVRPNHRMVPELEAHSRRSTSDHRSPLPAGAPQRLTRCSLRTIATGDARLLMPL